MRSSQKDGHKEDKPTYRDDQRPKVEEGAWNEKLAVRKFNRV
jgi:hypothetical protein